MLMTSLEPWLQKQGLYELGYGLKLLLVSAALLWGRSRYPRWQSKGMGLALGLGIAGAAVWIGLSVLDVESALREKLPDWLQATRSGTDPFGDPDRSRVLSVLFVGCRLIGLIAVVPVMEEVFWRGFLLPYLIEPDFHRVAPGTYSHFSFAAVTLAFVAVHPEWIAALVWGLAIGLLFYRVKNLWACVIMHMTTNAILGVWIFQTESWHLW